MHVRLVCLLLLMSGLLLPLSRSEADDPPRKSRSIQSPLLRGLKETIEQSEVIEESGASDSLLDQLEEADSLFMSIKAENALAMRMANRQLRIGAAKQSPNALLITVDRMGWQDAACYGQKTIRTPHLDRLAAEGLRLTRYYAGSGDHQAGQWSLMTGLSTARPPRTRSPRFQLHDEDHSIARVMWDSGYVTAWFGLWSAPGLPTAHGFENWSGFTSPEEALREFPESIQINSATIRILDNQNGKKAVSAERLMASELRSWFDENRREQRQFFAKVSLTAFPESSDAKLERTVEAYRQRVERTDWMVGAVLNALEASGLRNRTIVIFAAESGPDSSWSTAIQELNSLGDLTLSPHGLSEGNVRVPCLVRWPGKIAAGQTSQAVTCCWDILPTLCDITMAQRKPRQMDGVVLTRLFTSGTAPKRDLLYWESGTSRIGQAAMRNGWKAVRRPGEKTVSLYQIASDPGEAHNVADRHPEELNALIIRR